MKMAKNKFNKYHTNIYFPPEFSELVVEFISTFNEEIELTAHAAEEMYSNDKRGHIPLPTKDEILNADASQIFEFAERKDRLGRIQKAAFRLSHLSEKYDYSYVIARDGVIITSWANDKDDWHTLKESKDRYIQAPKE